MDKKGYQWTSKDIKGQQWTTMDNNGQQWTTIRCAKCISDAIFVHIVVVIGDVCVCIACDGVCELVILQMQNPPGTALRPLLQLAVEKRHFHKVENIKAASARASLNVFKLVHKNATVFQLYRPVVK